MTAESAAPALNLADLGLTPDLLRRAAAVGWRSATAVQAAAIPAILQGRDLLAVAPTGSGKTATFVLPLLQRLLAQPDLRIEKPRRLRALILTPTRELALQIGAVLGALAPPLKTVVTVGGGSINPQLMALRGGAHLVVATPGRLLDLIGHKALSLAALQLLVLDEADRLLDLGFADEVGAVLAGLPKVRQTLMLSATMPDDVAALAGRALHDPLHVDVGSGSTAALPDIRQRAIQVDKARRTALLRHLIRSEHWPRVLVFVATQHATEHVADKLRQSGVPAAALHGALSQGRRNQALADLHSGALTVLVATDLAARGIDVTQLPVVVNHDLPRSWSTTRTASAVPAAGRAGLAVSFIMADAAGSKAQFRLIEKRRQQRACRASRWRLRTRGPARRQRRRGQRWWCQGPPRAARDKLREAAALRP
jgi:superfamily II DNA/RNA helicase